MNPDAASLSNLRDIVTPPPPPWWPPAAGWWFVLAACGVIGSAWLFLRWRHWRQNAYRRAALRELREARTVETVAEILKRTALAVAPRTQVASLSGPRWIEWLAASGGRSVPVSVNEVLTNGAFTRTPPASGEDLTAFAAQWIRDHQVHSPASDPG